MTFGRFEIFLFFSAVKQFLSMMKIFSNYFLLIVPTIFRVIRRRLNKVLIFWANSLINDLTLTKYFILKKTFPRFFLFPNLLSQNVGEFNISIRIFQKMWQPLHLLYLYLLHLLLFLIWWAIK